MSSAFVGRRRADQFDALVGDPTAGLDDARFAELLEVVGALQSVPAPQPRADFSASLRERLMAEADTVLLPRDRSIDERLALHRPSGATRTRRDRRLAVAAGTLAVVGATTSMAMAAQTALPGDALYPIKRALEDAQAGVSVSDGAKGTALLANAAGRLDELGELARLDDAEEKAAAPETIDSFVAQAQAASDLLLEDYTESGDAQSIAELRDFTAASMAALTELESLLPVSARDELRVAAEVLAEIDELAARLCPTCGGSGITQIPLTLLGVTSTALDDIAHRTRDLDPTAATGQSGNGARAGVGSRGPGRPVRQQPATPAAQPGQETGQQTGQGVQGSDSSPFGPGSVFQPSSPGDSPTTDGGQGGQGGSGSDGQSGSGGGLGGLLGGGSTGVANDDPLAPVLEPLKPALEPLAPLLDPATDALGGALGTD